MRTIDIHTHLLNPQVHFDRLFDRISVRFFARNLGADPVQLMTRPFAAHVDSMARAVRESKNGVKEQFSLISVFLCSDPVFSFFVVHLIQIKSIFRDKYTVPGTV